MNDPCERCGERPNSWFIDAGYICDRCMDEWRVFGKFYLDLVNRIPARR